MCSARQPAMRALDKEAKEYFWGAQKACILLR